jgi:hypothetical protein
MIERLALQSRRCSAVGWAGLQAKPTDCTVSTVRGVPTHPAASRCNLIATIGISSQSARNFCAARQSCARLPVLVAGPARQTRLKSSSLLTTARDASISAISMSKTRPPP